MRIVDYTPKLGYKRAGLGVLIATLLISSILAYYYRTPTVSYNLPYNLPFPAITGIQGTLVITVNGHEVIREPDVLTQGFYVWLANILNGNQPSTPNTKFTNGCRDLGTVTSKTTDITTTVSFGGSCVEVGAGNLPAQVGIGTGQGSPANTDTAMFAKLAIATATVMYNSAQTQLIVSGTFSITSSTTITESGLYIGADDGSQSAWCGASNTGCYFMASHDTFTGIAVNNGDVVVVSYIFNPPNCNPTNNANFSCSNSSLIVLLGQSMAHSCTWSNAPYCIQGSSTTRYLVDLGSASNAFLTACDPSLNCGFQLGAITTTYTSNTVTVTAQTNQAITNAQDFYYSLVIGTTSYKIMELVVASNAGVNLQATQPFGLQLS